MKVDIYEIIQQILTHLKVKVCMKVCVPIVRFSYSVYFCIENALHLMLCGLLMVRYEQSGWGWNDKQKHEEMTEEAAWYLIARDSNNKPVALSHFRFEVDEEEEVLYWYVTQPRE